MIIALGFIVYFILGCFTAAYCNKVASHDTNEVLVIIFWPILLTGFLLIYIYDSIKELVNKLP